MPCLELFKKKTFYREFLKKNCHIFISQNLEISRRRKTCLFIVYLDKIYFSQIYRKAVEHGMSTNS